MLLTSAKRIAAHYKDAFMPDDVRLGLGRRPDLRNDHLKALADTFFHARQIQIDGRHRGVEHPVAQLLWRWVRTAPETVLPAADEPEPDDLDTPDTP